MAPKDGLEQPTTGEEPVDEPFAEADEVGQTPITVSNSDESEEFVTSRCRFGLRGFHFIALNLVTSNYDESEELSPVDAGLDFTVFTSSP